MIPQEHGVPFAPIWAKKKQISFFETSDLRFKQNNRQCGWSEANFLLSKQIIYMESKFFVADLSILNTFG